MPLEPHIEVQGTLGERPLVLWDLDDFALDTSGAAFSAETMRYLWQAFTDPDYGESQQWKDLLVQYDAFACGPTKYDRIKANQNARDVLDAQRRFCEVGFITGRPYNGDVGPATIEHVTWLLGPWKVFAFTAWGSKAPIVEDLRPFAIGDDLCEFFDGLTLSADGVRGVYQAPRPWNQGVMPENLANQHQNGFEARVLKPEDTLLDFEEHVERLYRRMVA